MDEDEDEDVEEDALRLHLPSFFTDFFQLLFSSLPLFPFAAAAAPEEGGGGAQRWRLGGALGVAHGAAQGQRGAGADADDVFLELFPGRLVGGVSRALLDSSSSSSLSLLMCARMWVVEVLAAVNAPSPSGRGASSSTCLSFAPCSRCLTPLSSPGHDSFSFGTW